MIQIVASLGVTPQILYGICIGMVMGGLTRLLEYYVTSRNGGAGGGSAARYLNPKTGTWTLTPPTAAVGEQPKNSMAQDIAAQIEGGTSERRD